MNAANTRAARRIPPTPRQDAAQLLLLARLDPTTDLSVAADVLHDTVAAVNAYGQDWRVDYSGGRAIYFALWGSDNFEPVYGFAIDSVAECLAFCERLLKSDDDLCESVARLAIEQAMSMVGGVQ